MLSTLETWFLLSVAALRRGAEGFDEGGAPRGVDLCGEEQALLPKAALATVLPLAAGEGSSFVCCWVLFVVVCMYNIVLPHTHLHSVYIIQ